MQVFVTGASGWIGTAVVGELLATGHDVIGLARTDESAAALASRGVTVRRGDLDDLQSLRDGAASADAVIHLANKHDWSDPVASASAERTAVDVIATTLAGSDRPFLFASGVAGLAPGRPSTEADPSPFHGPDSPRGGSENLAFEFVDRGVRSVGLRFAPTVHGPRDHGFIATIAGVARAAGVSGYPGDGSNRWSAVHVDDAARLVVLGLDRAPAGARLHVVGEQGVSTREIAEAIGRDLDLPVAAIADDQVDGHFGWIGRFFAMDLSADSTTTQQAFGWHPAGTGLIDDILGGAYN